MRDPLRPTQAAGDKHDKGKPSLALLPAGPLLEVARVLAYGARKYGADNWRAGFEYRRLISAALRHIVAFGDGEDLDQESRLSHLAHAVCMILFLENQRQKQYGEDDRYLDLEVT